MTEKQLIKKINITSENKLWSYVNRVMWWCGAMRGSWVEAPFYMDGRLGEKGGGYVREGSVWRGCLNKCLKMMKNQPCGDGEKSIPSSEDNKCKGFEVGTEFPVRGTKRSLLRPGEMGTDKRLRGVGSTWATRGLRAMVRNLNFTPVVPGMTKKKKTDLEALASAPCWWHHTKSQHGSICIFP